MILAVDPGLATCGWAVIDSSGRVPALGVILTEPDDELDEAVDRARRIAHQADILRDVAIAHGCRAIACEAMSFGGPPKARFAMAISVGLSWGGIVGVATSLGIALYSVPPKVWERAAQPGAKKKVDYPKLEASLAAYVSDHAAASLAQISVSHRNHALDGVGIGLFVTFRPEQADRILNVRSST